MNPKSLPMKTSRFLQSMLAGVAAVSFLVYILACSTSFSPDDRQVIYPTFDPQSGANSVALYNRNSKHCETLLISARGKPATNLEPMLVRAEWLPDGKHILIGQLVEDSGLLLTVLARDTKEPAKNLIVDGLHEAAVTLEFPFAVAGSRLFLNGNEIDPIRIDLVTGETCGGQTNKNPVIVLPKFQIQSLDI